MQDGVVLDGGGDEVVAGVEDAEEGEVVAFGAAGGEDDLGGAATEEASDGLAGVVDGGACVLALLVDGAGVAEVLEEEGTHGVEDLGEQGGGGVRVHVDALHGFKSTPAGAAVPRQGMGGRVGLRDGRRQRCSYCFE